MNALAAAIERRRAAGYVVATLEVRQASPRLVTGELTAYGADGCPRACVELYPCWSVDDLLDVARRAAAETWRLDLGEVTDTQVLGKVRLLYFDVSAL